MAVDAKTRKRIGDLLRTADPKSGASDNERQIAALEAARLIAENGLTVAEPESEKKPRPRPWARHPTPPPPPPPPPVTRWYAGSNFREVEMTRDCECAQCGRTIRSGEHAFFDENHGYIHQDITCRQ